MKPLGYYRKEERQEFKKQNKTQWLMFASRASRLVKQIHGYFWCGPKKAKDGWPGGCQSAETNSFLSSELKIYPSREADSSCQCAEEGHRRSKGNLPIT